MATNDRGMGVMLATTVMVAGVLVAFFAGCLEPAALSDAEWRERLLVFCDLAEQANEADSDYLSAVAMARSTLVGLPEPPAELAEAVGAAHHASLVLHQNIHRRKLGASDSVSPSVDDYKSHVRELLQRVRKAI